MLDDLRRIIESEMEYDDLNDIMMEATDNSIADMFIEEDGEAVISDSEVMSILEKIPDYDEEAAMNKKLARIAEAYIPEELEYEEVEEGLKDFFKNLGKGIKVNPLSNVGAIKFGMGRDELPADKKTFKKNEFSENTTDSFKDMHIFYDKNDKVTAVEIYGDKKINVSGIGNLPRDFGKLCNMIQKKDPEAEISDSECISKKFSIGVQAEDGVVKSVLFGSDGYYAESYTLESYEEDDEDDDDFLFEAFGLEKLKKKKVDIEVIWGGGKEISCAIIEPENHEKDIDSIRIPTPEKFIDPDAGGSDEELLAYVKKSIKKQLRKKGYKINKIFMH